MRETTANGLLNNRLRYRQFKNGHRTGFEPVFLAASVPVLAGQRVIEAGTGAGAALLCLAARVAGIQGLGIEIDPDLAGLAAENFADNGFARLESLCADVTTWPGINRRFDHALANPPWFDRRSTISPDRARALAHHSDNGVVCAWVTALARLLEPGGTMTLILPASRLDLACEQLETENLSNIAIFRLWPRIGKPASQIIIQAKAGSAARRFLPGLIVHSASGNMPEAEAILRGGEAINLAEEFNLER